MYENQTEGILLVNKPRGISSFEAVRIIRNITNVKKVGHAGTLDPEAEGLLLILIGRNATKHSSLFLKQPKRYLFELIFGIKTTSGDRDGYVIDSINKTIDKKSIENALSNFKGKILQKPHMFSAIHHEGKRLYEIASIGEDIEIKPREVNIYEIILKSFKETHYPTAEIEVFCSSGTYIRSLAEDIGQYLGSCAFLSKLVRLSIGNFVLDKSNKILDLKENEIKDKMITVNEALNEIKNTQ